MIVVIILVGLSTFFAWLEGIGQYKHGLIISFILIFLFLALRYNYGSDYGTYFYFFKEVATNNIYSVYRDSRLEVGWIILNFIFKPIGFFGMIAALACFNSVIYYRFIKKFVYPKYYWFAVYIYTLTPAFLLVHSTAMRQSIAISIFLFSLDFLLKKHAIRYLLCICLASLFHYSAIILLLLYPLFAINFKVNTISNVFAFFFFVLMYLFGNSVLPYINIFITTYFTQYDKFQVSSDIKTGLGVLYSFISLLIVMNTKTFQDKDNKIIFSIAILSFILIPLNLLIIGTGRVNMYLTPVTIIVYPTLLLSLKKPIYKYLFVFFTLFVTAYLFSQFFDSDNWTVSFKTYQTIFSPSTLY